MHGVFVNGSRPKSKKAVKEALAANPASVSWEATSFFGNEFDGSAEEASVGTKITFVGPDPNTKRNFYGNATKTTTGWKLT